MWRQLKAIFPGSFDPVTLGHLDLMRRGARLFDRVVVAVLSNTAKAPMFTVEERLSLLEQETVSLPNVDLISYDGLLAVLARDLGVKYILRGVRSEADCAYEIPMAQANRQFIGTDHTGTDDTGLETVFMVTDAKYSYVSSGLIREIASFGFDTFHENTEMLDRWVPPAVKYMLINKNS